MKVYTHAVVAGELPSAENIQTTETIPESVDLEHHWSGTAENGHLHSLNRTPRIGTTSE